MEEDHIALPFLDGDGGVLDPIELVCELRHLVVMRGEERAAAVDVVQVFKRCPGDGKPVIGRRSAPDLVENDDGAVVGLVQDRGGLDHLDHEGRAAPREVVGRADPAEDLADDADMGAGGGHETARLGEKRNQGILAEECRLAGHVRAREQPERARLRAADIAVVGDEGLAGDS